MTRSRTGTADGIAKDGEAWQPWKVDGEKEK